MTEARVGRLRRAVALAAACAAALGLAGHARATPRFVVMDPDSHLLGDQPTTLQLSQDVADKPVSKVTIYAPPGYTATIPSKQGTRIGDVYAQAKGPLGGVATLKGPISVGDPSKFDKSPCADDRKRHDAVLLLSFGSVGGTITVPLFLDKLSGKDARSASYKLQLCLSTPVGAKPGQRVTGLALLQTTIGLANLFRNPGKQGDYVWRAVFTPYSIGKHVQSEANEPRAASVVELPAELSLAVELGSPQAIAIVRGSLEAAGRPIPNTTVAIYADTRKSVDLTADPALTIETDARGAFTGALGILGTTWFRAAATVGVRDVPSDLCKRLFTNRGDCATANLAPFFVAGSGPLRVAVSPRR